MIATFISSEGEGRKKDIDEWWRLHDLMLDLLLCRWIDTRFTAQVCIRISPGVQPSTHSEPVRAKRE